MALPGGAELSVSRKAAVEAKAGGHAASLPLLEFPREYPICETRIFKRLGARGGPGRMLEAPAGPRNANGMAWPLSAKGFRSMSRMTFLENNVWLRLVAPGMLDAAGKGSEAGYPPYNIELLSDGASEPRALRITLAVAGFAPDDLEVSVEGGELVVRGKQQDDRPRDYLHRGIAARQFKRSFQLASGVEVRKAELNNGLLAIELVRPQSEKRVMKVDIATAK